MGVFPSAGAAGFLLALSALTEALAPPVTVADASVLGFCPFLPQVSGSLVRRIYIRDCHVFLEN